MPRPTDKKSLLALGQANFDKLNQFIAALSPQDQVRAFPPGTLNRNPRDVLAHLHHWHLLMLNWYEIGMKGEKPEMPAPGYTWKTTSALNRLIWAQYQGHSLAEIQALLQESFLQVRQLIVQHSDPELFEKKRYPWTGSTSLGAYLISATSSHYAWALKLIRKAQKGRAEA